MGTTCGVEKRLQDQVHALCAGGLRGQGGGGDSAPQQVARMLVTGF